MVGIPVRHSLESQAMPFTPLASDRLGRRAALFIGASLMLAGVAVQCSSVTVAMFIGARFLSTSTRSVRVNHHLKSSVGFGLAFATNAGPLLITELAYPTQVSPHESTAPAISYHRRFPTGSGVNSPLCTMPPGTWAASLVRSTSSAHCCHSPQND